MISLKLGCNGNDQRLHTFVDLSLANVSTHKRERERERERERDVC